MLAIARQSAFAPQVLAMTPLSWITSVKRLGLINLVSDALLLVGLAIILAWSARRTKGKALLRLLPVRTPRRQ